MNNIQFTYDTPIVNWEVPKNGIKVILDPKDNITNKTTEHGNYEYTYDDLYRLATVDNPSQYDDEDYTYDNVGNRLSSTATTGAWSYNQNNELGGYDTTSFVYDDNGNMVQKIVDGLVTSYVYNIEDRLTEVWDGEIGTGTLVAEYYYDPFGRRLWKEVSGFRTYFHYADEGLIGEYDSAGSEIKTYGYKPNSTWTTDPLFMKVGSEYYFYHNDHLGTPQKMTGVNGAVVWSAKYSAFGKAEVDPASTVENNLRFPGQYEDAENGLYYNWNRYYDQNSGRYLKPDPIRLNGGLNYYRYADNNPLIFIDSNALFCVTSFSITIPIPFSSSRISSLLTETGAWRLESAQYSLALPSDGPSAIREVLIGHTGVARCLASRRLVYEDTYQGSGIRLSAGYCVDVCNRQFDFWTDSEVVLLEARSETRIETERVDRGNIPIQSPNDFLASVACTQWLHTLH